MGPQETHAHSQAIQETPVREETAPPNLCLDLPLLDAFEKKETKCNPDIISFAESVEPPLIELSLANDHCVSSHHVRSTDVDEASTADE